MSPPHRYGLLSEPIRLAHARRVHRDAANLGFAACGPVKLKQNGDEPQWTTFHPAIPCKFKSCKQCICELIHTSGGLHLLRADQGALDDGQHQFHRTASRIWSRTRG